MIFNILDNTTELWMTKYILGEIFSSGGATLYKNPSDQTVEHESAVKIEALALLSSIQGCVSKVSASFNLFCQFDFLCFPQEIFLNEFNCHSKMWHGIDFFLNIIQTLSNYIKIIITYTVSSFFKNSNILL